MTDITKITADLKGCPIARIAKLSGVSRPAIEDIRDGITTNPGILTVDKIRNAIREFKRGSRAKRGRK